MKPQITKLIELVLELQKEQLTFAEFELVRKLKYQLNKHIAEVKQTQAKIDKK